MDDMKYDFLHISVLDQFVSYFANQYVTLRSSVDSAVLEKAESLDCGMDIETLMSVIKRNAVYIDPDREKGDVPKILKDIYRSDLGELMTSFYFEVKQPDGEKFIIPLKNIASRERYDMPGRGIDAIGYRIDPDGKINLLLAEAKVSEDKKNPPSVVDTTADSIYKTQKKHHDDLGLVMQRLTEYVRHISSADSLNAIALLLVHMDGGKTDKYRITYGCGLVRDYTCSKNPEDFGKMKTNKEEFAPGEVMFAIFSFDDKTIAETVDLFYNKVKELTQ